MVQDDPHRQALAALLDAARAGDQLNRGLWKWDRAIRAATDDLRQIRRAAVSSGHVDPEAAGRARHRLETLARHARPLASTEPPQAP